jgi:hypothetical protein
VYAELFAVMAARAHRPLRRALGATTYLLDSSGLRLDQRSLDWARFSEKVCGVKLHVVYDADADRPIWAAITPCQRAPKFPQKWAVKIPWFGGGVLGAVISRRIDRQAPLMVGDHVVSGPAADGGASWT